MDVEAVEEHKDVTFVPMHPALLFAALAASFSATIVVLPNADAIGDWGRQNLALFVGADIMAIIVTLIIILPPGLLFAFCIHLFMLLWVPLKRVIFPKRGG